MKERDRNIPQASKMKFVRNIVGYRKIDHKKHDEIWKELNVFKLNDKLIKL
jgi:hypothetical protein